MENIFLTILGISLLFFILLAIKELFSKRIKEKFCVICTAVVITWISLLLLYWVGLFSNKIIIALLVGHTSLGIFYLLEKKAKEKLRLFRLPFLLTLVVLAYSLLEGFSYGIKTWIFLLILWLIFYFIYLLRTRKSMKAFFKKIVECCKKW
jgi:hypothetical protein